MAISRYKLVNGDRSSVFIKDHRWKLYYLKGKIVQPQQKNSLIFTFDTYENAKKFMIEHKMERTISQDSFIIRVLPIGKGIKPKLRPTTWHYIHRFWNNWPNILKSINNHNLSGSHSHYFNFEFEEYIPNDGTILYPAVKVME